MPVCVARVRDELQEEDKFERLKPGRKHLMDTIKMIAYRAETAMSNVP